MKTKLTHLFQEEVLMDLLREGTAAIYPQSTLDRRIGLLTKKEKEKVHRLYELVLNKLEELDDIIATRAEKENDPWP